MAQASAVRFDAYRFADGLYDVERNPFRDAVYTYHLAVWFKVVTVTTKYFFVSS